MDMARVEILATALLAMALITPGCITADEDQAPTAGPDPGPAAADTVAAEPQTVTWSGHVLASELDGPSHVRPTEDAIWPIQQEGVLVDIAEIPTLLQVSLDWTGEGSLMIMLHSHKADGTNTYVEHVSEMSAEHPQCIQVPTEDLTTGHWQVMVHSDGARALDFTLTTTVVGGAIALVEDDRHGHWPQDGAFEVDEHEVLPCGPLAA